ncbi:MAG: MBL fold metallo-hydrolase [Clostridia bacterium]|nr:MBL fold metallo-hydrolase [Clostridia bacterium]
MILKRLQVKTSQEGLITNTYIICDEKSKETLVVDPGGEPEKIIEMLDILKAKLKYIFLTHCHADHIGGINELKAVKGGKILISRADSEGLYNEEISLAYYINAQNPELEADSRVDDGDLIHIGELEFKVIETPGHTKGGLCLYCEKERLVFTGDTLFSGTWGRTDLPTGNFVEIMDSITYKLMTLPDETIVYPGHGRTTMISDEKNIYLELKPKEF